MVRYEFDASARARWEDYPIRIQGATRSKCHNQPNWIVRSQEGGFVTANCSTCGAKTTINEQEFVDLGVNVSCPKCAKIMAANMMPLHDKSADYCFVCDQCKIFIKFGDLLPDWHAVKWSS